MTADAPTNVILHYIDRTRAERVAWLFNELGIEYTIKKYEETKDKPNADLLAIHPVGRAPVVEIDGKVLAEAQVIADYVMSKYGAGSELAPKNEDEELAIKYHVSHCEATVLPLLTCLLISDNVREKAPYLIKGVARKVADGQDEGYAQPNIDLNLNYLEGLIAANGNGYFVGGHLTLADIMYSMMFTLAANHIPEDKYPELNKWVDGMRNREAFSKRP